jgi:hypothetical protein
MISIDRERGIASCSGCYDSTPIRRAIVWQPDALMEFQELYALDHQDCDKFQDVRKAQLNRKFRKESKRLRLIGGKHGSGIDVGYRSGDASSAGVGQ